MRELYFVPVHLDLPIFPDERLGQIERVVVILRITQGDRDIVRRSRLADGRHLREILA